MGVEMLRKYMVAVAIFITSSCVNENKYQYTPTQYTPTADTGKFNYCSFKDSISGLGASSEKSFNLPAGITILVGLNGCNPRYIEVSNGMNRNIERLYCTITFSNDQKFNIKDVSFGIGKVLPGGKACGVNPYQSGPGSGSECASAITSITCR